ncbi:MAG: TolC family protein [Rubrivivax sp.]|nr:MAG: TolC family protein [Rubrivivax sp.]
MRSMAVAAVAVLGGCTGLTPDGGFGPVQQIAQQRLGKDVQWARSTEQRAQLDARVAELLAKSLSVDDAVQIALFNHRGLQASFAELGIAESDLVAGSRLPNPGFSFARLRRGGEVEFERSFGFDLARLITLPLAKEIEARRFAQARLVAAQEVLSLASDVRKAYFTAVAADQSVHYMGQVRLAAEAAAELAGRMAQAGNWSKLQQAREQVFQADAALNLVRAEQEQLASRERLTRLMGLSGDQVAFKLPERLPELPKAADDLPDVEQTAMAQRLDLQAAKQGTEQLARNLGLSRATRFINVLEVGAVSNSSTQQPTQRGFEVSLSLPLFDWGTASTAKAEALYMQAVNRTAQMAVDARSEVRLAYKVYLSQFDIARQYRDEIVPLKKRISDENLLRYNGMLIGVFELLADARAQIDSVNGYIQAQRDFWIARSELDMALMGKPTLHGPEVASGH